MILSRFSSKNQNNSIPQPQMAQNAGGQEVGAVHGKKQPMKREMKEEQEQFGGHNNNNMMLKTDRKSTL